MESASSHHWSVQISRARVLTFLNICVFIILIFICSWNNERTVGPVVDVACVKVFTMGKGKGSIPASYHIVFLISI